MLENDYTSTTAEIIKVLDIVNKKEALRRLGDKLASMDWSDEGLKTTLFKLLPPFFAHSYINSEMKSFAVHFIETFLQKYETEVGESYAKLLEKWRTFFSRNRKTTNTQTFSLNFEDYKESDSNPFNETLGYDDLEFFISVCKYLKYRKLHKYMYFFSNLTYLEFLSLKFGKDEIVRLEEKVGIRPITVGARGAVLSMMTDLGGRVGELRKWAKGDYFWRTENTNEETQLIKKTIDEIDNISRTPIRKRDPKICAEEEEITALLVASVKRVLAAVERCTDTSSKGKTLKLLGRFSACYFFTHSQKSRMLKMSYEMKTGSSSDSEKDTIDGMSDTTPSSSLDTQECPEKIPISTSDSLATNEISPKREELTSEEEFEDSFTRMVDYLLRLMED